MAELIRIDLVFWETSKPFYSNLRYTENASEEFQRLPWFPRKMVLYLSTNFPTLKLWGIIFNFIRFNLRVWQASKPFYRKLKYRENVLEEFHRLPRFPRKMALYSSINFCILNPWGIISNLIRFHLGFLQASKPFYRKLNNREKVLEEFQQLSRFPRKSVLYSSTNFGILRLWVLISNLIRFDLGFSKASKSFYSKVKYREKVLKAFQRLRPFLRIMDLYSSTNFCILKTSAITSNFIRFNLGFWQPWKPFYRKLKYTENVFEEFQRLPCFPRIMDLYAWTNFRILKSWAIISNLIRFDLGFWQALQPFYRKLKCREKVLEEFQRFLWFCRKMVLYSSTNFCILKPWAIISNLIRFQLGFWWTSKPFYRKLKYKETVLEELQRLPRFSRKMVFYSSTNFGILKPWAMISNLIGFNLGFWQASKPFYRKLKDRDKAFEEFNDLPCFPREVVFYSSTTFHILKPLAINPKLRRFDLCFCKTWKPFYRKLKNKEKVLEEFERLPRLSGKMVLYSSSNFRILKPWAMISNLIRFNLGFWQAWKPFYGKLKYREKVLEEFQRLSGFSPKMVLYSWANFRILKPWAFITDVIRFDLGFWEISKAFYSNLKYREKVLEGFRRFPRFPRKMVLYSATSFRILKLWGIIFNFIRFDLIFWQAFKPFYIKLKYRERVLEELQGSALFTRKMVLHFKTIL